MTGGVPDDGDRQPPSDPAIVDGNQRPSMGRVTLWRVVFVALVVLSVVVGIASLFYGGLPSDG